MDEIRKISGPELPSTLRFILADPLSADVAHPLHVEGFLQNLRVCAIPWECCVLQSSGSVHAAALVLSPDGGTAIVMFPSPGALGIGYAEQTRLLAHVMDSLRARDLYYAQALIETDSAAKRDLLTGAGFWRLARLLYLERGMTYPWMDAPPAERADWVEYSNAQHSLFAATVQATYQESFDCPRLTGLRPIEAVLAGHKAGGKFDPTLWQVAMVDGECAGCLLLSQLDELGTIEVAYMGVTPRFRNRGMGGTLLRRALALGRTCGGHKLTLVVDEENTPAAALYARFGLKRIAARDAFLFRW